MALAECTASGEELPGCCDLQLKGVHVYNSPLVRLQIDSYGSAGFVGIAPRKTQFRVQLNWNKHCHSAGPYAKVKFESK